MTTTDSWRPNIFSRDFNLANARFDHAQNDNSGFEVLLPRISLHGTETRLPIGAFRRFV